VFVVANGGNAAAANFCDTPTTNQYLIPLEHLPTLHQPPTTGTLPFTSLVHMRAASSTLVAGGEAIGFIFSVERAASQRWSKPWLKVKATFVALDRHGHAARVVHRTANVIGWSKPARAIYVTPHLGRVYRVDILFERGGGAHLQRYSKYFRSTTPTFAAHVAVSESDAAPGGSILARLENTGVLPISAGYGYRVERLIGVAWEVDPALQGKRIVPKVLVILGPAASFDCVTIPIPSNQPAGQYRVVKEVGRRGVAGKIVVSAEFSIL